MSNKRKRSVIGRQLPDDLVVEILSRLPSKSLSRFRCVSKLWNSLITNVTSQRRVLLPMPGFVFHSSSSKRVYIPISPESRQFQKDFESPPIGLRNYHSFCVIHSCNGLLLFTNTQDCSHPPLYVVWNPVTKEFASLPEGRSTGPSYRNLCFLAYDPCKSPHYKVVRFILNSNTMYTTVVMFSSMTGRWAPVRIAARKHPLFQFWWDKMAVFHRGALHMISSQASLLIRFDVEKGSFHLIQLPGRSIYRGGSFCFGESRGHLYYAVNRLMKISIYMLDEQKSDKWLLTHKMSTFNGILCRSYVPITFHPESEVVYFSTRKKILSYNPHIGKVEEICEVTECDNALRWWEIFPVIPCLESLPGSKLINSVAMYNNAAIMTDGYTPTPL